MMFGVRDFKRISIEFHANVSAQAYVSGETVVVSLHFKLWHLGYPSLSYPDPLNSFAM